MFTRKACTKAKLFSVLMGAFLLSLPASAQTDNCCGIDRQCSTNDEWVRGYYAFRNSQCVAPAGSQAQAQARQDRSPPQNNNCCFSGWQCETDAEWTSGYWAFRRDRCGSQAHWEEQLRAPKSADAASTNDNQFQQDVESGPQPQSNQETGGIDINYESKRYITLEDGTPVGIVVLSSWAEFWRAYCRTYPDEHDLPECS